MSSTSLRGVLAGSLVTAFLSLGNPASGEAASSWWGCAWQWIAAQLSAAQPSSTSPAAEEPTAPAPPEAVAGESQYDAGWILDPNG